MDVARAVGEEWIAAWNERDLERIMSHYAEDVRFESPRVAAAFKSTGGQVGSPDGVLLGAASLRPYFQQGLAALPHLHLELLRVLEGPPGWWALRYRRETGAEVVESFRLRGVGDQQEEQRQKGGGQQQQQALEGGRPQQQEQRQQHQEQEGQQQQQQGQQQEGQDQRQQRQQHAVLIDAVRVFYDTVC
ncbi:hypothetical protein TSOC_002764 [Tetrabaena socialis]|uniref:SnoaL-like domain-containing protein n=1 Tax=Tetrabaena socialis TaxID=47790 RepID=A0A2J8AD96_9CHLO|nr:hypothetical protein TSOC_002764 [Tetrabaena socialis]|eukprot:PNH10486.1 hypothetical protein TSOC_002764 [Tetrabaena socialis]